MEPVFRTSGLVFQNKIHYPDLQIEEGAATFIKGPSGSGKSTLLRLFNATASGSSGSVFYQGRNLDTLDTIDLRREAVLAGQSVYLFPDTIENNFRLYHQFHKSPVPDTGEISSYLELCGMSVPTDSTCRSMSGGERQRVYLAIALSMRPAVLMLDEPTSALDGNLARQVMDHIKTRCQSKGTTLIVISHDDQLTNIYADHTIFIGGESA